jgi:hypothetical protein
LRTSYTRPGKVPERFRGLRKHRRTAAFRLLQRPDDLGIQIPLRVRRQSASWKGPRVGQY